MEEGIMSLLADAVYVIFGVALFWVILIELVSD